MSSLLESIWAWLTDSPAPHSRREKVQVCLNADAYGLSMGVIVVFNMCLVIIETDSESLNEPEPRLAVVGNRALVYLYLAELAFRFYSMRANMFFDIHNCIDILLVLTDIFSMLMRGFANTSILRMLRVLKLTRTLRLIKMAPELYVIFKGFIAAGKAIFWGSLLSACIVAFWGIIATVLIHPVNERIVASGFYETHPCERCPRAYQTVWQSAITFTQTMFFGDSWGTYAVPIIEESPSMLFIFVLVYISINLAVLNLILAVIVDAAIQAREKSTHELAKEQEANWLVQKQRLSELFRSLDGNSDGKLSLTEIEYAYDSPGELADLVKRLDVRRHELPAIFDTMDADNSGFVSSDEFVNEVYKMHQNDLLNMMVHIKYQVHQIRLQLVSRISENIKESVHDLAIQIGDRISAEEMAIEKSFDDLKERKRDKQEQKIVQQQIAEAIGTSVQDKLVMANCVNQRHGSPCNSREEYTHGSI